MSKIEYTDPTAWFDNPEAAAGWLVTKWKADHGIVAFTSVKPWDDPFAATVELQNRIAGALRKYANRAKATSGASLMADLMTTAMDAASRPAEDGTPPEPDTALMRVVNEMRDHDTEDCICTCDRCLDAAATITVMVDAARGAKESTHSDAPPVSTAEGIVRDWCKLFVYQAPSEGLCADLAQRIDKALADKDAEIERLRAQEERKKGAPDG